MNKNIYRLPDGTQTRNSAHYVRTWRKLAAPILKLWNKESSLYSFDPGILMGNIVLTNKEAIILYEALTKQKFVIDKIIESGEPECEGFYLAKDKETGQEVVVWVDYQEYGDETGPGYYAKSHIGPCGTCSYSYPGRRMSEEYSEWKLLKGHLTVDKRRKAGKVSYEN